MSNSESVDDIFQIIQSYFGVSYLERLIRHHLESYNKFIDTEIKKTVNMFNPIHIKSEHDYVPEYRKYKLEIEISFSNLNIFKPIIHENTGASKLMFPTQARLRNFTYNSNMTLDMHIKYIIRNGEEMKNTEIIEKTLSKINIGKIPIMLKSNICLLKQFDNTNVENNECKFDAGGYFIINGSEKTVLGQERAAENKVYCFNISKNSTKWTWCAELKSVPDYKCLSPKQIYLYLDKKPDLTSSLFISLPRLKNPMPLFVMFRVLGITSDKEICKIILLNHETENNKILLNELKPSIIDANKYMTKESADNYLLNNVQFTPINMDKEVGNKKKQEFVKDILENDLFPHCKEIEEKIYYMGYMANRIIKCKLGILQQDDRDSYINKRVDTTGVLLNNLFRNYFNKLVKDMQKQVTREINQGSWKSNEDYENIINQTNIYKIVKSTTIENGLKRALATGDFGIKQVNSNKVGVAQVLNRLTYISSLSHLRRVNTPIDKSGKLIPPRKLHNTSWGFTCPAETPEGASVGVVKNLSYLTHITTSSNSKIIYEFIKDKITRLIDIKNSEDMNDKFKVFINGSILK